MSRIGAHNFLLRTMPVFFIGVVFFAGCRRYMSVEWEKAVLERHQLAEQIVRLDQPGSTQIIDKMQIAELVKAIKDTQKHLDGMLRARRRDNVWNFNTERELYNRAYRRGVSAFATGLRDRTPEEIVP